MTGIREQLAWETDMIERGSTRFRNQQAKALDGREHETSAGSRLMREYVLAVTDQIELYLSGEHPTRRRTKHAALLGTIDASKVAMFTMRQALSTVFDANGSSPLAKISINIGRMCQDELRFMQFETEHKEYYDTIIRDFARRNTTSYKHMRRVLIAKGEDQGLKNKDWSAEDNLQIGSIALGLMMEVSDLVEITKRRSTNKRHSGMNVLSPTAACTEWILKHNDVMAMLSPDRMPCLVEPADWLSPFEGGFYSPRLRSMTPLIKIRENNNSQRREMYKSAYMPGVLTAINAMQKTAWEINNPVLDVIREVWSKNLGCGMPRSEPYEFPKSPLAFDTIVSDLDENDPLIQRFEEWKAETRELHTMEKERVAKNLALVRTIRLASEMATKERFWYVYQCDFRGRVYATASGLNPQGTDAAKALIRFHQGSALGETGLKWFLINGANKFGYDSVAFDERVEWITSNSDKWQAVGEDPISHRAVWAEADKPYQFLAWCMEYAKLSRWEDPTTFVSHLPVGLDGSCNGLQHFSAMLRDAVGGAAVNLIPSDKPSDIYQDVGDVCTRKLKEGAAIQEGGAVNWYRALPDNYVPRKLPKVPVMTLPYGSTRQACTGSVYSWQKENIPNAFPANTEFRHALFMSNILWDSIGEVVIAARAAMDWIQECSSIISKQNKPLCYYSPIGFPVLQSSMKEKSKQIRTQIAGNMRVRMNTPTKNIDVRKQRQGSSPNLIHHVDACHMMMCINACVEAGIEQFAMIHDDFGAPACHAEALNTAIRQTFVELHRDYDILGNFKETHEELYDIELPPVPPIGGLDIEQVLKSPYFFA